MKKSKQKHKAKNWAANLQRIAGGSRRLPPIKARTIATGSEPERAPAKCGWCHQVGHNVRTCPNPKATRSSRTHVVAPAISHKIVISRRAIAVRPLKGQQVLHVAYDQNAATLHVAFKGQFKVHWYAFANVPPQLYGRLLRAKDPDEFVAAEVDPKFTKTYVHRRKPLPPKVTK